MMQSNDKKLEEIERVLLRCGIYPSKKGFKYLRCAIDLFAYDNAGTCDLYDKVAKVCGVKSANVERCIRTCLTEASEKGTLRRLNEVFEMKLIGENDYLSNGDFIGIVGMYLGFGKL